MERSRITPASENRCRSSSPLAAAALTVLVVLYAAGVQAAAPAVDFPSVADPSLRERVSSNVSVRVIVRLADPDVPWWAAVLDMERTARRWEIADEQVEILADLARAGTPAPAGVRRFRDVPFIALVADSALLQALERSGRVVSIEEDRLHAPFLNQTVPLIGADLAVDVRNDGSGWAIAVIDTGVDANHAFLTGRVAAEACFSANGSCPNGTTTQFGAGAGTYCDFSTSCFHGTHVAGIATGSTSFLEGVAPGASVVSIQVFSEFTGSICDSSGGDPCALAYTSDIVAGLQHVSLLSEGIDVAAVNMSLGGGSWGTQASCDAANPTLKAAIDGLRAAGVASIVSSGNGGSLDSMGAPACISSAVSVGATDDADGIASFSNSADFLALLAPGVSVASSVPLGLLGFEYGVASGTSMSAPHVAGAWAIARQVDGAASVDTILAAFQSTGLPILDSNGVTAARISVLDAIEFLGVAAPLVCVDDADGDGVCDPDDNCSDQANATQIDSDQDGYGNACDADYDNNGVTGGDDYLLFRGVYGTSLGDATYDPARDSDGNDRVDASDFFFLRDSYGRSPGPSGLACAGTIPCTSP